MKQIKRLIGDLKPELDASNVEPNQSVDPNYLTRLYIAQWTNVYT